MSDNTGPVGPPTGFRPMPDRAAQQAASRKKNLKIGLWSVGAIALLTFSMVWNPPAGRVHSFTSASDYKASTDSGCTNSGEGCHGDEDAYKNFNDYHPDAECTTCHEYQGVGCIPCHKPDGHECQSCHDGTMDIAADRNRITDPYPKGHYRETTHTAMGTDMNAVVRATEGGAAQAACEQCHSRDLYASHQAVPMAEKTEYGDSVGCGECHNDTRASGLDQVKSNWPNHACEDCHDKDSSAPMHDIEIASAVEASGPASCGDTGGGCHDDTNLHTLHADAPKDCSTAAAKGEPGCHDLKLQSHEPSVTACGDGGRGCHAKYLNGDYSHKSDRKLHAVSGSVQARDSRFGSTACSQCHALAANGMSLTEEHERPNNSIHAASPSTCEACHNNSEAATAVVHEGWEERSGAGACEACHDSTILNTRHTSTEAHEGRALTPAGTPSDGACQGYGCHFTLDLQELHDDTGCTTDGCHQNSGDIFGLNRTSCGGSDSGRACHVGVHDGANGLHIAGRLQAVAMYYDAASGQTVLCLECHSLNLITDHSRSNSAIAGGVGTVCARCHDATDGTREVVDGRWTARSTSSACTACHRVAAGVPVPHNAIGDVHFASELTATGTVLAGTCAITGCHPTRDVRVVHKDVGCTIEDCHQPTSDIRGANVLRCGGTDAGGCHSAKVALAETTHKDHSADLTGTVSGVTYATAQNLGCFGCHYSDLTLEHSKALQSGSMEGGGASTCRICHEGPVAADNGSYAGLESIKDAIESHDRRCIACHKSGSFDGAVAVASPHSVIASNLTSQPVGAVWTDPLDDWKAALNSTTGGGHNALSAADVGASQDKDFPITSYSKETTTYTWVLQNNTNPATAWLRTGEIEGTETAGLPLKTFPSATTTEGIQAAMVTCEDCHVLENAAGPQGAAVKVSIDPAYAQTEYANPTPGTYQFDPFNIEGTTSNNPPGYKPVICVKCHLTYVRSRVGTSAIYVGGGAGRHSTHRSRHDTNPSTSTAEYEACIDCHMRIPHAWKRPRLLTRTIPTSMSAEGVAPDTAPYVRANPQGLRGITLQSFSNPAATMSGGACSAGLCEGTHVHSASLPATQAYWP